MTGIGPRLREERERLCMTQKVFGLIGGVEPNAQGKYESGERTPKADYLANVACHGVDVLYVLTGQRIPMPLEQLSNAEENVLGSYRVLPREGQEALHHMALSLAEMSANYASKAPGKTKPGTSDA
ncbi:helix-turn-helix transcriptional regulator [Pseudomonas sp. dw_358]|uniref:helix-turn-helix domain-containing protein n=1 Tax=Pseudomonas sp. dw_358 TaxID=2720083 RepID=UPI001BD43A62|nr:helix-turn-helix transcriptional regulator [Pseudomonas sp. dw_358]